MASPVQPSFGQLNEGSLKKRSIGDLAKYANYGGKGFLAQYYNHQDEKPVKVRQAESYCFVDPESEGSSICYTA